jgi:hypothetical protein
MKLLILVSSAGEPARRPKPAIAKGESVMLPVLDWATRIGKGARQKEQSSVALFLSVLTCRVQFETEEGQKKTQSHIACCGVSLSESKGRQTNQQTRSSPIYESSQSEARWAKTKTVVRSKPVSAVVFQGPSPIQRAQTMWR